MPAEEESIERRSRRSDPDTDRQARSTSRLTEKGHEEMSKAMGKRTVLLLAAIAATLVACSGAALAVTVVDCGSFGQDPLTPQCYGTKQEDDVQGREAADIIFAYGGNDTVDASAGDDLVYSGTGRDSLAGGPDDDDLFGGKGADFLTDYPNSYADQDELRGGGGNDRLDAFDNDYNDTLVCGPGNDDIVVFDLNTLLLKHDEVSATCEHRIPGFKLAPRQ
jgi:hypothetical protein